MLLFVLALTRAEPVARNPSIDVCSACKEAMEAVKSMLRTKNAYSEVAVGLSDMCEVLPTDTITPCKRVIVNSINSDIVKSIDLVDICRVIPDCEVPDTGLKDKVCDACTFVTKKIYELLSQPYLSGETDLFLEEMFKHFPEFMQQMYAETVHNFIPDFFDILRDMFKDNSICKYGGICGNTGVDKCRLCKSTIGKMYDAVYIEGIFNYAEKVIYMILSKIPSIGGVQLEEAAKSIVPWAMKYLQSFYEAGDICVAIGCESE